MWPGMRKPGLCTQNTPVYINYKYLPYCIRYSQSVSCMRFLINCCINGEKFVRLLCLHKKLFNFEFQKCDQISCAHKTHFLMPGHICIHTYITRTCISGPEVAIALMVSEPMACTMLLIELLSLISRAFVISSSFCFLTYLVSASLACVNLSNSDCYNNTGEH